MLFFKRWQRRGRSPQAHGERASMNINGVHPRGAHTAAFVPVKSMVYGHADAPPSQPFLGSGPSQEQGLRGLRLLLAEDHEVNAMLLIEELEFLGARVDHALDGEAACRILMSGADFDAVLMDCQMPNLDGFAATRRIRAWEAANGRQSVPIIALTGVTQDYEQGNSCDVGMNGYLVKPCEVDEVAAAVWLVRQARKRT